MLNLPLNYYLSITLAFTRDSQILFWNVSNFLWRYPTRVLPWGLTGKESSCSAGGTGGAGGTGDASSIPGSGRLQGEGNGNPLQYSCLENPMNRGACSSSGGKEPETTDHHHHHHSTGESIHFLTLEHLSYVKLKKNY